jgi:type I restriction enzyme S subunit
MAGEWRECEWGDIAILEYGKSLRGYRQAEGRYRVYGTNGPIGWHDQPLCGHPGVIVGRKGAYRGIHYSPAPFFVIDTAFYLRPKEKIDLRWAYYCLLTYDINGMDSGSAIPSTSRESFYHLPVRVPPVGQQRAIACILGALDDKIELNRQMNETLEAMARAIFKSWFVDFDPVRAKAEGRQPPLSAVPGPAQAGGLAPHIADLFPDAFEKTELGEIPKGWRVGCLRDIIEIHDSKRIPLSSRERQKRQGPFPYYGAAGIVDHVDDFLFDGIYVLVGEDGSVVTDTGKPVVQYVWGKFWVNNHAHVLKGTGGISDEQLLLLLQQIYVVPFVTGAVQPKFSQTNMKAIPVVHGSPRVNQVFGDIVRPVFAKIRAMQDEVETLAILRDTLLPRLISGELRLLDAERIVGRCV